MNNSAAIFMDLCYKSHSVVCSKIVFVSINVLFPWSAITSSFSQLHRESSLPAYFLVLHVLLTSAWIVPESDRGWEGAGSGGVRKSLFWIPRGEKVFPKSIRSTPEPFPLLKSRKKHSSALQSGICKHASQINVPRDSVP